MMKRDAIVAGLGSTALSLAAPAYAEERDYCPARPGLGTPACTMEPGKTSLEIGAIGWTRDKQGGVKSDAIDVGDVMLRVGVSEQVELFAEWQAYGHVRERIGAVVSKSGGAGDVTLGLKANLANPDGSGFSLAVQPFVSFPTGGQTIGAGDWGAGLVAPMSYELPGDWSLQFTGEVDAAVDADRKGRHFAGSATVGVGKSLSDTLAATAEVQVARDADPAGKSTQTLGGLSLGWSPNAVSQWDIGTNIGLSRSAPDFAIYGGYSRRF